MTTHAYLMQVHELEYEMGVIIDPAAGRPLSVEELALRFFQFLINVGVRTDGKV